MSFWWSEGCGVVVVGARERAVMGRGERTGLRLPFSVICLISWGLASNLMVSLSLLLDHRRNYPVEKLR